jgi:uncharacterized membrane protein YphA (DoxX/SURF4 family)
VQSFAPSLLRISIALVFLWFGLNQLLNSSAWLAWLPSWMSSLSLLPTTIILLNGLFETVLGLLLLMGFLVRPVALLLSLHLFGIVFSIGYNDIAVRDVGLALATFVVFLQGDDFWCLSRVIKK